MTDSQSPAPVAGAVEAHIQALVDLAKREASHLFDVAPDAEDMAHLSRAIENLATFARALAALHPQPAPAVAVEAHRLAEEAKTAWGRQDPHRLWNALDALEALAARSAPAVAESQWMPIETVPKDGTPILVWLPVPMLNTNVHAATYHPNLVCIGGVFAFDATSQPTHWCHQPAPPTVGSGSAQEGQAK